MSGKSTEVQTSSYLEDIHFKQWGNDWSNINIYFKYCGRRKLPAFLMNKNFVIRTWKGIRTCIRKSVRNIWDPRSKTTTFLPQKKHPFLLKCFTKTLKMLVKLFVKTGNRRHYLHWLVFDEFFFISRRQNFCYCCCCSSSKRVIETLLQVPENVATAALFYIFPK